MKEKSYDNWKISPNQFKILVILCFISTSILLTPAGLTVHAKQDAWIAAIIGSVIGLVLVWFYSSVGSLFEDMSLIEYTEKVLGKWIGKIVAILFVFFLYYNCSAII